jgi:hypothetical protein
VPPDIANGKANFITQPEELASITNNAAGKALDEKRRVLVLLVRSGMDASGPHKA